jgi:uncharacterized protein (TIGR00369 family)
VDLSKLPRSPLDDKLGIVITEAEPGRVVATMPVEGNTQPFGLLHGGANGVIAETVGSVAAALEAGPGFSIVGTELSCTHHGSAKSGLVTATATKIHQGRQLAVYDIRIVDENGRPTCTARLTCMIRPMS